jgi:hypothetical protein
MSKWKLIVGLFGIFLIVFVTLATYVIATQNIESLLTCVDSASPRFPFSSDLCRNFLFTFRGSKEDIDELQQGIGASFVLNGQSPIFQREQVLKFLVSKGLQINQVNVQQLTPLHGAVLANSADEVKVLLRNGADVHMKDKKFNLTPLEFALYLQEHGKIPEDRKAVISLLSSSQ